MFRKAPLPLFSVFLPSSPILNQKRWNGCISLTAQCFMCSWIRLQHIWEAAEFYSRGREGSRTCVGIWGELWKCSELCSAGPSWWGRSSCYGERGWGCSLSRGLSPLDVFICTRFRKTPRDQLLSNSAKFPQQKSAKIGASDLSDNCKMKNRYVFCCRLCQNLQSVHNQHKVIGWKVLLLLSLHCPLSVITFPNHYEFTKL